SVRYFEQHLEAIAFTRQLELVFFGLLEIERVVDGDGHLSRDLAHEIELRFERAARSEPKHQRTEAMLSGGERQPGGTEHAVALEHLHDFRPTRFLVDVRDDERLL